MQHVQMVQHVDNAFKQLGISHKKENAQDSVKITLNIIT